MSMIDIIKAYKAQQSSWNEVREQRIYRAVLNNKGQKQILSSSVLRIGGSVAAALFLIVVLTTIVFSISQTHDKNSIAASKDLQHQPLNLTHIPNSLRSSQADSSTMILADVGKITVNNGGEVHFLHQTEDIIVLEQTAGEAIYDIMHRENRSIMIIAAGVEITVIGTVFVVSVEESMVRVEVKRGVVKVNDQERTVTLRASEAITVANVKSNDLDSDNKADSLTLQLQSQEAIPKDTDFVFHINSLSKQGSLDDRLNTDSLFSRVDKARSKGNFAEAAELLNRIIAKKENKLTTASAQFILGKVERARGRHAAAAEAFRKCSINAPGRSLAEDALAEQALSWRDNKNTIRAQNIARSYLANYPKGMYVSKMQSLLD